MKELFTALERAARVSPPSTNLPFDVRIDLAWSNARSFAVPSDRTCGTTPAGHTYAKQVLAAVMCGETSLQQLLIPNATQRALFNEIMNNAVSVARVMTAKQAEVELRKANIQAYTLFDTCAF